MHVRHLCVYPEGVQKSGVLFPEITLLQSLGAGNFIVFFNVTFIFSLIFEAYNFVFKIVAAIL